MPRQPVERKVVIRTERGDMAAFLDMLRYDQCTVVEWTYAEDRRGGDGLAVTLRSAPGRTPGLEFTPDRWSSFGLTLKEV